MYQFGKMFKTHPGEKSELYKSTYGMIPFVLVYF